MSLPPKTIYMKIPEAIKALAQPKSDPRMFARSWPIPKEVKEIAKIKRSMFEQAFFDELEKIAAHAGAWIKQRAEKIQESGGAAEPFAIAAQQAIKLDKGPKRFKTKEPPYGTPEGRAEALAKYRKPKGEYQQTP